MSDEKTKLYRAHNKSEIRSASGIFKNPYLSVSRRPRDSSVELHKLADEWFFEKFKIRFRSSALFGNGNVKLVSGYIDDHHRAISLYPQGRFKICYSPNCPDMYEHFKSVGRHPWSEDKVSSVLSSLHYEVGEADLWESAIHSGCEVMVYAEEFFYRHEEI